MREKMVRFLNSINIENIDRFDLDFEAVSRNPFDRNQIDMLIVKNTPWEYHLFDEFQDGLSTIKYPYSIKFTYIQKPTVYDAISLFEDWHRSHNRYKSNITLEAVEKTIVFSFKNEEERATHETTIVDFKEFLEFICYRFEIESKVNEIEMSEPAVGKREMKKLEKAATKVADETVEEESFEESSSYRDEEEEYFDSTKSELKPYEKELLEKMQENLKVLTKERHRKGKIKKSEYVPYEDFSLINAETGPVDIVGEVYGFDEKKGPKTIKGGNLLLAFGIGSKDYGLNVKAISGKHIEASTLKQLKNHQYMRLRGHTVTDKFSGAMNIMADYIDMLPPPALRTDESEEKRVELHLHTKMSTMDAVSTITTYCQLAKNMGHKAIAVTDHGIIQSFPEAQKAAAASGLKMIYGCELYVVNDELPFALNPADIELSKSNYVVFDLETTGLSTRHDHITEFGAVRFEQGMITKTLDILINPEMHIPEKIQIKTKITDEMLRSKPKIEEVIDQILDFFKDAIIVSHNITFDVGFLNEALRRMGKDPLVLPAIDTLSLSRYLFPESRSHRLGSLCKNLDITSYNDDDAHRADYDARILNEVWLAMLNRLVKDNMALKHSDLAKLKSTKAMLTHMRPIHTVALAKNKAGLHDLYELISMSHIDYLAEYPKTPKRELQRLRKNLLIGSACFNGEIFDIARTRSKLDLLNAMKFYDYIELQPLANYSYLVNIGELTNEELKRVILNIVEAADELHIPLVATGDVHYANPEDKKTRDVYISALAVGGRPHPLSRAMNKGLENPDQHFRSTIEMLEAFEYLGKEKAREVVITNTNMIADQIEVIEPVQKVLHTPVIEGAPDMLKSFCYEKAHRLYGDTLPEIIQTRLDRELKGIIDNGYSVTYYIAHQIIKKANSDGYMVGSRGSVGSSLAAFMYDITEVNPLPPHYRCPKCRYSEFVDTAQYRSGYDLPTKKCPICGETLYGDGQNIPFETFLGFEADKIPDIDLNFPSDYQERAFDYTKVVFGPHNVFRAGTIETVAEKTAFGHVRGYHERLHEDLNKIRQSDIAYLASKVADVKRTTGQHPGGIMVLPKGLSIYDFSPIQYPADDSTSSWFTTHLDYRALHDSLLKLDLLGHVDPLALRMMFNMTGLSADDIPLNDVKVISLFTSDKALGRKGNYLKADTGALGFPEFGTDTCQDILRIAKPKCFADLVAISGLAHGTDVWANNARELIKSGQLTIREVIGCRDDIMTYLIKKGLPNKVAFTIMEKVRKGGGVAPEFRDLMIANNVPQWYIDSCNKIQYMFPKAHAVAYVTQAVRVGYFKLYYPLEFYAVWFSSRCDKYDINALVGGYDSIVERYEELTRKRNNRLEKLLPKEKEILKMLTVAIEMSERGFRFEKIDLYRSEATSFVVDHEHGSLIPPFVVLDNLGESAAFSIVEARKAGKFSSREDLLKRTKLSSTNVEDLLKLGTLDGLGESDQMSLFEFGLGD